MSEQQKPSARPLIVLFTSHWVTMVGVTLVTLAGFSWLFVLPISIQGHGQSPYIGLLIFVAIPAVFFAGLVLVPIGIALAKRRVEKSLEAIPDHRAALRRGAIFFGIMTVTNVIIASQASFRAVEHMDTVQFCGQSCHVMKPAFSAHLREPHQQVVCASCHVQPGATGWLNAKLAGTRELIDVVFDTFPRPIESAMESNRLVSSAETCERCHAREKFIGPGVRVVTKYNSDEANTRTTTVLTMLVGGGAFGGIHGAHMGPGVSIRYAAQDKKRQTIPWVEYRDAKSGVTRTYLASDAKPDAVSSFPTFEMQCVDCHNRAAHAFETPDRAVDGAIATGQIPVGLPFVKKTAIELVQAAEYQSDEEAGQKIPAGLADFYQQMYPNIARERSDDIQAATQALLAIYRRNVFPDLKVTWGTYPTNLGHSDYPGCFRCHDDSHAASDKRTISQDCNSCHRLVAIDEEAPAVLKTLGVADRVARFEKK